MAKDGILDFRDLCIFLEAVALFVPGDVSRDWSLAQSASGLKYVHFP